ncbi:MULTISPECIES: DUF6602 domain-containing protein [Micrococcus]|uniref:DUF6602 domain-containing protein n=1 Tax=Micrococcus aloeverae TaxID=1391911 RepID=A0ABR6E0M9_9MICC|nr:MULTISPECIES: DUF6602 domain-containing protein [Micrococcus]MBA9082120.1 hypothetical protein [Micrococcus aloeverae]MCK6058325.1 hypothetical protein [Micrococcus luteus]MCK6193329.1 hypothetical protein [Micrococcus luteus]MCK6195492.1 hypothetical protein [Micrococcus luteus]MCV7595975.1 hypothetical protein [Micrococcus luteus]
MSSPIDLNLAFQARQRTLSAELGIPLEFTDHPTSIGNASEANWTRMLRTYLPGRYEVGPVHALDITGGQSHQIDIAIYDRQYAPIWFESPAGERIVPVESIYAVFEVKQKINASNLRYAARKAASVRQLTRTSEKIVDIHGTHEGPRPEQRPILSGILALKSEWTTGMRGETGKKHIQDHTGDARLDMGLALLDSAFDNTTPPYNKEMLEAGLHFSPESTQLLWFCLRLFRRLQAIGTAPAVDLSLYEEALLKSS